MPIDMVDSFLKSYDWGMSPAYLIQSGVMLLAYTAGMVAERRSIQLGVAVIAFTTQFIFIFQGMGVLGSW